jgi:hypothetical protein
VKIICTQKERESLTIELEKKEALCIGIDINTFGTLHDRREATIRFEELLKEGINRIEGDESG